MVPDPAVVEKLPNLLHRGAMIANAIITRLEGKINKKLAAELAAEMLYPPAVAGSIEKAVQRDAYSKALSQAILRSGRVASAGGIQAGLKESQ